MEIMKDLLPFFIPFVIIEIGLLLYVIRHIFSHENYKYGNRIMWLIIVIVGMNFIGTILYFIFGKEDE